MQPIKFNGQIIRKSGVYSDIPIETYHNNPFLLDGPSISSSGIRKFIKSPLDYWSYSPYNLNRFEVEKKSYFTFGSAAHCLLLGEGDFAERFAVRPNTYTDIKTGENKTWRANATPCKEWILEQGDKQILSEPDMLAISCIARNLEKCAPIQLGILNGLIEQSMFAKIDGVWLRSRPDVIPQFNSGDFSDVKTAASIDGRKRYYSNKDNGYFIQAAVTKIVSEAIQEESWKFGGFALVWCQKSEPYDVVIDQIDPEDIAVAEELVFASIKSIKRNIVNNDWPGLASRQQDEFQQLSIGTEERTRLINLASMMSSEAE